jgi:hypothetical protein
MRRTSYTFQPFQNGKPTGTAEANCLNDADARQTAQAMLRTFPQDDMVRFWIKGHPEAPFTCTRDEV